MVLSFCVLQFMYMARRSLEERNIRTLTKRSASYSVTLPIEIIRTLQWREGQKVVVEQKGESLVIKDWKK